MAELVFTGYLRTGNSNMANYVSPQYSSISNALKTEGLGSATIGNQRFTPTVVSDANIRESTIPEIKQKATDLGIGTPTTPAGTQTTQTETQTNPSTGVYDDLAKAFGLSTTNTGGQATPTEPGRSGTTTTGSLSTGNADYDAQLRLIDSMRGSADASTQAMLDQIRSSYGQKEQALADIQSRQKAGLQHSLTAAGVDRYAPGSAINLVSNVERQNLLAMNDLQAQENAAIAQANAAKANKDYELLGKQLDIISNARKEKQTLAQKVIDQQLEDLKTQRKTQREAQIGSDVASQANNGLASISDISKALAGKGYSPSEIKDAYDNLFPTGSGVIGEYQLYKKEGGQAKTLLDFMRLKEQATAKPTTTGTTGGAGITTDNSAFVATLQPNQASAFNKLSALDQSNVAQLLNGDVLLSDLMASRGVQGSATRQELLNKARSVDPTFSENENKQRYAYKVKWNDPNGKYAQTRTGINTAMYHLARLNELTQGLANNGDFQRANSLNNFIAKNVNSSRPADPNNPNGPTVAEVIAQFKDTVSLLATEVARAYKGGVPDKDEIQQQVNSINENQPKNILQAIINNKGKLMSGLLASQQNEYKKTMGRYPDEPVLNADTLKELKDAGVDTSKIESNIHVNQPTAHSIINQEKASEQDITNKISGLKDKNPKLYDTVSKLYTSINPETNQPYTPDEILQAFPELNQ